MSNRSRQLTWLAVGAGVVAVTALPQRSIAQCNNYANTYAPQRVRVNYGPAYRGTPTYAAVDRPAEVVYARPYAQHATYARPVVRREPVYAPVQYQAPAVVYVETDNYRYPTRRVYRDDHRSRRYVTSSSHGRHNRHYSRHNSGHRRPVIRRSHSGHGRRGFGVRVSAGRGHHGRGRGGVSFSYRR